MMKGFGLDESIMSNLTSTLSGETSIDISSNTRNESSFAASPPPQPPPPKKKRSLPGNPDPEAEVIALSPKSLLATNRFICEICNKGFQRDQNLQLHRRGHNLPWKLKQRPKGEVIRKKVYVCPESNCAHHDPSRALGDLTGIKKHFCRKHGEKKWKCDKCSKKYAVRSDWKAHSKICGTKEYRCDCGTLFSRRDSFITHRAFCDALAAAEDQSGIISANINNNNNNNNVHVSFTPWLSPLPPQQPTGPSHLFGAAPHLSATALLQKAAEMGVTLMSNTTATQDGNNRHVTNGGNCSSSTSAGMCSSRDLHDMMLMSSLQYSTSAAAGGFGNHDNQLLYEQANNQGAVMMTSALPGGGNPPPTVAFSGGGNGDGLSTRDFLGLRRMTHNQLINMATGQLRAQIKSSHSPANSFDHHQQQYGRDHQQQHDHHNQNQNQNQNQTQYW